MIEEITLRIARFHLRMPAMMARLHRAAVAVAFVAAASTACMLSTDGLTGGTTTSSLHEGCDATLCDDFNRTTPLGPAWSAEVCSGGSLTVDGSLVTAFPAEFGFAQCSLTSKGAGEIGHFSVDFDIQATGESASANVVPLSVLLDLSSPKNDYNEEQFQLSLNGAGRSEIGAIFRRSSTGAYDYYSLAASDGFIPLKTACHVSMEIDAIVPTVIRATSTCNDKTTTMTPKPAPNGPPPPGFSASLTVGLGYGQTDKDAGVPAWSLTYDNLVLQGLE